ncbi:type II toxin-antitoxin system Phd/YefM family antitoxin [Saccharopolyspora sp. NPDC002578]
MIDSGNTPIGAANPHSSGGEDGRWRGAGQDAGTPLDTDASAQLHTRSTTFRTHRRWLVKTMSYSESRAKYAETLNSVVDDREEVVIIRSGHEPVVMVALDDYESLKETAYLLKSPENARRVLASIDRLEHGGGTTRELIE